MTRIVIYLEEVTNRIEIIKSLRRITGHPFGEISRRLQLGEPIFEEEMYTNNYETIAQQLRDLMADIPATGAGLRIYELPTGESWETSRNADEMSVTALKTLLDESDREFERQKDLDDLGHV